MNRFSFRLEPLLRIRKHTERQVEIELAEVNRKILTVDRRIAYVEGEQRETLFSNPEFLGADGVTPLEGRTSPVDVSYAAVRSAYLLRLERDKRNLVKERAEVNDELEQVRGRFIEARRDREVLDRLKGVREKRHYDEQRRLEANRLDDVVSSRAIRRRTEEASHGS